MKGPLIAATLALVLVPAAQASTGGQLFAQSGCGGCHTLRAAGAYGDGGPNLDQLQPSAARVATQVTNGGPGMPSFGGSLSQSQIAALAAYVASATGSGGTSVSAATPAAPTMSKAAVKRIQRALHRLGYFNGPVTGTYGPLTTAAARAFQQASGLTADGIWGPATNAALAGGTGVGGKTAGVSTTSTAGLPPPRAWVKRLQIDLGKLGYFNGPDTGVYGPITTAAVKSFQAAAGITVDGRWGPKSQSALVKRLG